MADGTFDLALFLVRVTLGGMIVAHGYNHLFGAGGLAGTTRWFASLGFRPAKVHALLSGLVELAAGAALILGLLTALAAAALIGTMTVAGWAAHKPNGFFIFRDGYEYVLVVAVTALALALLGPGEWSVDNLIGLVDYSDSADAGLVGRTGGAVALVGGLGGATILLTTSWRPQRAPSPAPTPEEDR